MLSVLYHLSYTPTTSIWSYGVVVSISGCDPLDPGSTPGTANFFVLNTKTMLRARVELATSACKADVITRALWFSVFG